MALHTDRPKLAVGIAIVGLALPALAGCGAETTTGGESRAGGVAGASDPGAGPAYDDPRVEVCSALARHAPISGPLSADTTVAAAQQWRADSSLRSDASWVETVHREHPEPPTWAFPVTPEEHNDLISHSGPSPEAASKVAGYTARFPDTFAGWWIDQSARGRLTIAFTADIDTRRSEVDKLIGDTPHAVIEAATSLSELSRLSDEFMAWNQEHNVAGGWGRQDDIGRVNIDLYVRDERSVRAVAGRFAGRPVCVEGRAPSDIIPEGPQPTEGPGWRLLADAPTGRPWAVSAAQDRPSYERLWRQLGLPGSPPRVDFATELVLHFGPAVSGSCRNIRLDEIVVDTNRAVVYPRVVLPGTTQQACTSDANPYTYLVAMERAVLPNEFTLQIEKDQGRLSQPETRTVVHQSR